MYIQLHQNEQNFLFSGENGKKDKDAVLSKNACTVGPKLNLTTHWLNSSHYNKVTLVCTYLLSVVTTTKPSYCCVSSQYKWNHPSVFKHFQTCVCVPYPLAFYPLLMVVCQSAAEFPGDLRRGQHLGEIRCHIQHLNLNKKQKMTTEHEHRWSANSGHETPK